MKRKFFAFALFFAAICAALFAAPKYVILFIGDGFGVNARQMVEIATGETLLLDTLPARALTTTSNALGKTTDSAASGTAIACGAKTVNGALGLNADFARLESLAMRLQARGYKIGMVSSSPLNDATPAAHYAHQKKRKYYRAITDELAQSGFAFFGGQAPRFDNKKETREEAAALTRAACEAHGYCVFEGGGCLGKSRETPLDKKVCLWKTPERARFGGNEGSPTLADFTREAIRRLYNPNGFFLMVEKGDTDYASHDNDAGRLLYETLDYDKAVKVGLDFLAEHPDETLVVITSDHETGGLELENPTRESLARLFRQKAEFGDIAKRVKEIELSAGAQNACAAAIDYLQDALFSGDAPLSPAERARIEKAWKQRNDPAVAESLKSMYGKHDAAVVEAFRVRDARAKIRYTTFGHSNARVWTSAAGAGYQLFADEADNTEIPKRIARALEMPELCP